MSVPIAICSTRTQVRMDRTAHAMLSYLYIRDLPLTSGTANQIALPNLPRTAAVNPNEGSCKKLGVSMQEGAEKSYLWALLVIGFPDVIREDLVYERLQHKV